MMEQVRLCTVCPTENWLATSMNHTQGWMIALNMLLSCFREKMPGEDRDTVLTLPQRFRLNYFPSSFQEPEFL